MFRIYQMVNRNLGLRGSRPSLEPVPNLPAYETRLMAEKIINLRIKKVGWSFWSAPWLLAEIGGRK